MQNDNLEARKMFQRYDSVGRKFLLAVCSMTLPLANVFADYIDVSRRLVVNGWSRTSGQHAPTRLR